MLISLLITILHSSLMHVILKLQMQYMFNEANSFVQHLMKSKQSAPGRYAHTSETDLAAESPFPPKLEVNSLGKLKQTGEA